MRIFLIGYMGSGKSSTGKRLARALGLPFVDTDIEIKHAQQKSISDIFKEQGEMAFREMERDCLLELQTKNSIGVFATGGGMPCFHDNMKLMNQLGITIYLKRPAKELAQRLENSKKSRPLIADKTEGELLHFVEKQLIDREKYYALASITANRNEQTLNSLIDLLHLNLME